MLQYHLNVVCVDQEAFSKNAFIQHIHNLIHVTVTGPTTLQQLQDQMLSTVDGIYNGQHYSESVKDWCNHQLRKVGDVNDPEEGPSDIDVDWDTVVINMDQPSDAKAVIHIDFIPTS